MRKPIFENEEEAILIMKSVVIRSREWELNIPETLKAWREEGYIRSSPVEEAEEMFKDCKENYTHLYRDEQFKEYYEKWRELAEKQYEAIQYLKAKLEEKK